MNLSQMAKAAKYIPLFQQVLKGSSGVTIEINLTLVGSEETKAATLAVLEEQCKAIGGTLSAVCDSITIIAEVGDR